MMSLEPPSQPLPSNTNDDGADDDHGESVGINIHVHNNEEVAVSPSSKPHASLPLQPPGNLQIALTIVFAVLFGSAIALMLSIDRLLYRVFRRSLPFLNHCIDPLRLWQIRCRPNSVFWRSITDFLGLYDLLELTVCLGASSTIVLQARRAANSNDAHFVLFSGVFCAKHAEVSRIVIDEAANQRRSHLLSTFDIAIPAVLHPSAPVFVSSGVIRNVLIEHLLSHEDVRKRMQNASELLKPVITEWLHSSTSSELRDRAIISRLIMRCFGVLLFGIELDEQVLQLCIKYESIAGFTVLPRWLHVLFCGVFSSRLLRLRLEISEALPLASNRALIEAGARVGLSADDVVMIATDSLMFAGLSGSTTMIRSMLARIDDGPVSNSKMEFLASPTSFIYECMRIDPPVASVTSVTQEPRQVSIRGRQYTLPAGARLAASLSLANTDTSVWGADTASFKPGADRDFGRALVSWNGRVYAGGPRICPGRDISLVIARLIGAGFAGLIGYRVRIETGGTRDAGSSLTAFIRLNGEHGSSADIPLSASSDPSVCEEHVLQNVPNVGRIHSVNLWRESSSLFDRSPNWYVNTIEIQPIFSKPLNEDEEVASLPAVFKFPLFGWIPCLPEEGLVLEGSATLGSSAVRRTYLAHKQREYAYTTQHSALGDWQNTLPTSVRLDSAGKIPIHDRPLLEESDDFRRSVTDAVVNAGLAIALKGPEATTLAAYSEAHRLPNAFVHGQDLRVPISREWQDDRAFSQQFLGGMNPVQLKAIKRLPEAFGVCDNMLPGYTGASVESGGDAAAQTRLEAEMAAGKLFMLDNDMIVGLVGKYEVDDETRYLEAPFALFHADAARGFPLMPIAIQIQRHKGAPVFTPRDTHYDWLAAKMFVSNCHFHIHQFRTHALWCHFSQETLAVSVARQLPSSHPIYKLLHPHFHGLLAINNSARGGLVAAADHRSLMSLQGDVLSTGAHGNILVAQAAYAEYRLEDTYFEARLAKLGLLNNEHVGDFPYRDDGRLILASITAYVTEIVYLFYASDEEVAGDVELQSWAQDLVNTGKLKGVPGNGEIRTRALLVHFCANTIFTASAFHAAVNFTQIRYGGTVASMPGSLYGPPPTQKGGMTEAKIIALLPPHKRAVLQVGMMIILSTNTGNRLSHLHERLFVEEAAIAAQRRWTEDLDRIQTLLEEINNAREEPYLVMMPNEIPNSTAI